MVIRGLLTAKAAASVAAGLAIVGGGTVAAAAVGMLPTSAQNFAHHTFNAPAVSPDPKGAGDSSTEPTGDASHSVDATDSATPSETPVGPDATGPAAFGLCNAFAHGGLTSGSIAYRNLATAAGGANGIAAYCLTVVHPGRPSGAPTHPTTGPSTDVTLPTQANTGHPTGRPASVPVGPPSGRPAH